MERNRCISLLDSTSSIGRQSLGMIAACGMRVAALTTDRGIEQMEKRCRRFRPELAVMIDPKSAAPLRLCLADTPTHMAEGMEGLLEAASLKTADAVFIAVVEIVRLRPTLAAIRTGKRITLANKRTLVCTRGLVSDAAAWSGSQVVPVDSEHSAIFQYLQGCQDRKEVRRLILTASGGPFWGWKGEDLTGVTVEQALTHPNQNMGTKISVDSATMMNKRLEFIEAMRLYHVPPEKTSTMTHRENTVHFLVEYYDHTMLAQLGVPDMRLPAQYTLAWPGRVTAVAEPLDLLSCPPLTFHTPDYVTFPYLTLALEAARTGGTTVAMLNEANEEAVRQSLSGQFSFFGIVEQVAYAMAAISAVQPPSLGDILDADQAARKAVQGHRPSTY